MRAKRIIQGQIYSTETSTKLAGTWTDDVDLDYSYGEFLYQTRHGAYFSLHFKDGSADDHTTIKPLTPDEVVAWLEQYCGDDPDKIESVMGARPEAGGGEVTCTIRMPMTLCTTLAAEAHGKGQSVEAWIVRRLAALAQSVPTN